MSWERDPLYAKAKIFFERAFDQNRDDPLFGLWCSLGLELLARAALASISPALLAEPDKDHRFLLHALGLGSERVPRISIKASHAMTLCRFLFPDFTEDDLKMSLALINRRNEELHSGTAAFDEYRQSQWLAGFYRVCQILSIAIGESLESLFGKEEAIIATQALIDNREGVKQRVQSSIAAHKKVFQDKKSEERESLTAKAVAQGEELSILRHHRVICPACKCVATIQGTPFGRERVTHEDGEIALRQAISPTSFSCSACGLELTGYAELAEAGLADQYTRKTTCSPEEYYGLIDPDDLDSYMEGYFDHMAEYDNE